MPETKRSLKVFLCHASQDKPVIRELSRHLVGEGWIDTWLDEKKLLPGQDWRLAIEEAVEDSDIVIICLSSNSVSKEGHVQKELRYAREIALEKPEGTIFIIPLRLDECEVPRGLRFYQWVDYFRERKAQGYDSLVESLKSRYEQKLRLEQEEGSRQEKYRKERETAEKIVREKAKQDAAEKARLKDEKQVRRKAIKDKAERQAARKAAIAKLLSKAAPFLRVIGILGIIIVLFWASAWVVPEFIAFVPTPQPTTTATQRLVVKATSTSSPVVPTKTTKPTSTLISKPTATPTLSSTSTQMPKPISTLTSKPTSTLTSKPTIIFTPSVTKLFAHFIYSTIHSKAPVSVNFDAENSYLIYENGMHADCFRMKCEYKWTFPNRFTIDFSPNVGSQTFIFVIPGTFRVSLTVCWHGICDDFFDSITIKN